MEVDPVKCRYLKGRINRIDFPHRQTMIEDREYEAQHTTGNIISRMDVDIPEYVEIVTVGEYEVATRIFIQRMDDARRRLMVRTAGDRYGPAMEITDEAEAQEYLGRLVAENMANSKNSLEKADHIERENLGYYAGYYNEETRRRVENLFGCAHPVFGSIEENGPPTAEEAFKMGLRRGIEMWGEGV